MNLIYQIGMNLEVVSKLGTWYTELTVGLENRWGPRRGGSKDNLTLSRPPVLRCHKMVRLGPLM